MCRRHLTYTTPILQLRVICTLLTAIPIPSSPYIAVSYEYEYDSEYNHKYDYHLQSTPPLPFLREHHPR